MNIQELVDECREQSELLIQDFQGWPDETPMAYIKVAENCLNRLHNMITAIVLYLGEEAGVPQQSEAPDGPDAAVLRFPGTSD